MNIGEIISNAREREGLPPVLTGDDEKRLSLQFFGEALSEISREFEPIAQRITVNLEGEKDILLPSSIIDIQFLSLDGSDITQNRIPPDKMTLEE